MATTAAAAETATVAAAAATAAAAVAAFTPPTNGAGNHKSPSTIALLQGCPMQHGCTSHTPPNYHRSMLRWLMRRRVPYPPVHLSDADVASHDGRSYKTAI